MLFQVAVALAAVVFAVTMLWVLRALNMVGEIDGVEWRFNTAGHEPTYDGEAALVGNTLTALKAQWTNPFPHLVNPKFTQQSRQALELCHALTTLREMRGVDEGARNDPARHKLVEELHQVVGPQGLHITIN